MKANNHLSPTRWLCLALLGVLLNMVFISQSQARMGGGHSYSSGHAGGTSSSGHSSGGGWGGGHWGGSSSSGFSTYSTINSGSSQPAENTDRFTLFIEIIILILVIYVLLRLLSHGSFPGAVHTFQSNSTGDLAKPNASLDEKLLELKTRDPNFSGVLFLDFASLLYHKFYTFRGSDQFRLLSPYLAKGISDQTTSNVFYPQQRIHDIVIGKAMIVNVLTFEKNDNILVEFESNLSLQYLKTNEKVRFVTGERWMFGRQKGVLSPPPTQMRTLSCPSCGAPADFTDAGECQYCHSFIQAGEKQWQVVKIDVINNQPFKTESPGGYQQEAGTDLPTIQQAGLEIYQQTFVQNHRLKDWQTFFNDFSERVVKPYFLATYAAWSKGDWRQARHLVSDRLYESNGFWMEEYSRQGWRNRLENIEIQGVVLARIDLDTFYESLTVRIFASCLDYTVDKQGKLIGGSQKTPRKFSEYWTFIRAAGVEKIEKEYDLKTCPSCGAPAEKVGQAGVCGYCGSKISDGDFSWVLAVITQDEVYEG